MEIKCPIDVMVVVLVNNSRFQNRVAHCLAILRLDGDNTAASPCISGLVAEDYNSITLE